MASDGGYPGHQDVYFAGMENENATSEDSLFLNIDETRQVDQAYAHTGNSSARLNASENTSIGPMKYLKVRAGQRIAAEVFAKYEDIDPQDAFTSIGAATLATAAGAIFSNPVVGLEGETLSELFSASDLFGVIGAPGSKDYVPSAYLNYILFDNDYNVYDLGFIPVTESAEGLAAVHDYLNFDIDIAIDGHIYIFVSNSTYEDVNVYFDDFLITHYASPFILESTDYYPFGSVMRQFSKPDFGGYRFGYQGEFAEEDEETGWNHFELRQYDAKVGRFVSVDPYRQFASPYIGIGNNPINGIDRDGGWRSKRRAEKMHQRATDQGLDPGDIYQSGKHYGFNLGIKDGVIFAHKRFGTGLFDREFLNHPELLNQDLFEGFEQSIISIGSGSIGLAGDMKWSDKFGWTAENGIRYSNQYYGRQSIGLQSQAKRISAPLRRLGTLGDIYSMYHSYMAIRNGDTYRGGLDLLSSAAGFAGPIGAGWSLGWDIGAAVTTIPVYQRWKHETWLPFRNSIIEY